jgi:hypothetical protein
MQEEIAMKPKDERPTQFLVHLQGITLSKEDEAVLANELQAVALRHLGRSRLEGDLISRFPKEWLGLWLERAARIELPSPIGR